MRKWRYEHQGDMWMRGGRASCFGRFFCCTVMIFLFLVVSIVLSLALVSPIVAVYAASVVRFHTVATPAQHHHRRPEAQPQYA